MCGIINPEEGIYVNPSTGEKCPIPAAMSKGLIKVSFTTTKRSREKKSSIGIITVKTIREQVGILPLLPCFNGTFWCHCLSKQAI